MRDASNQCSQSDHTIGSTIKVAFLGPLFDVCPSPSNVLEAARLEMCYYYLVVRIQRSSTLLRFKTALRPSCVHPDIIDLCFLFFGSPRILRNF